MRHPCHGFLAALAIALVVSSARAEEKIVLASANFDFVDTSGEPRDQSDEHKDRLAKFSDYLRRKLAENSKFRLAGLPCQASRCTATDPGFKALSKMAKQEGADYLVIGIIRKTSSLIGWVEYSVLNVGDNRSVCGELITYRSDTDESWQRAARFSAGQIASRCTLKPHR
ncbi:MAG: DUF2380 domain-containing protein [Phyllobacterium sp.]